jgi:hypothetical protein
MSAASSSAMRPVPSGEPSSTIEQRVPVQEHGGGEMGKVLAFVVGRDYDRYCGQSAQSKQIILRLLAS